MIKTICMVTLMLIFLGCGEKTNKKAVEVTEKKITMNDTKKIEKKKVTFLHYFTGSLITGSNLLKEIYNKESKEYELISTPLDHEAFKNSIRETLDKGNPPDIYSYWAGARVQSIVEQLEPLDDMWEKEKLDSLFSNQMVESACTYNGKKYLVPITQHYVAFFYNKAIFEKLKIKTPETWEEFISVCETIKKSGTTPIALGAKTRWPAQFWFDYLILRTAPYEFREDLMNGKALYSDPKVKKAFKLWAELIKRGFFNKDAIDLDWDSGANEMVYKGEAAMTLMGTWVIGEYSDDRHKWIQGKDYDFFSFPIIDKQIPKVAFGAVDGLVIPKKAVNIDGAKNVLCYLSNVESQKYISKGWGAFAPNKNIQKEFYTEMQQRVIGEIESSKKWTFNYDLSTKPEAADRGLLLFIQFLEFYDQYETIVDKASKDFEEIFKRK